MRSSIPTTLLILFRSCQLRVVAIPFKWGQVFQRKNPRRGMEHIRRVAIPFKWGQVFQLVCFRLFKSIWEQRSQSLLNEVKYSNTAYCSSVWLGFFWSQSLLNEVKYSNLIVLDYGRRWEHSSQSLLNEVKYSNEMTPFRGYWFIHVAIPFKWGQVFQRQAL